MRVLVLWADRESTNLGVRVLADGTAALVRRVWPEAEVVHQNYGARIPQLPTGRLRSLVRERVQHRVGMMRWLAGFDLVVDTRSGDSFTDIYGQPRHRTMCAVAEFARQAGVPVVFGPQTIGPFETAAGRALGRFSLRRAALVMARDSASAQYAASLGRPVDVLTSDVVFALPVPQVPRTRDVVLNVSGLLWRSNPHVDHLRYRETVGRLYRELVARGREVTLLAHVVDSANPDNDVPAIREFTASRDVTPPVVVPRDLTEVRETVASARVVIGSRMHACLNALSVGTPAVPLAYSRKFAPLLADLGWSSTVDLRTAADPAAAVLELVGDDTADADAALVADRARAAVKMAADALREVR